MTWSLWWGVLDTTLCDKVCQWLGVDGEVYSIQQYVIKFVSDLELMVRCTEYNIMW